MLALVLLGGALALCAALFVYLRYSMTYWQRRKIPAVPATMPWGNYGDAIMGRKSLFHVVDDIYRQYKDERYIGSYFANTPLLHLHDPEIIRQVFIKEFQDFNGRGVHCDPENDPLSGHLFNLSGQPWRNMRVKLSPTFTTGKIKYMFGTISECADHLRDHIRASTKAGGGVYEEEVRELIARFSTDVISSVAFGIESNSMKNPNSEFRRMGQRIFEPTLDVSIRFLMSFFAAKAMSVLGIHNSPRDVEKFFLKLADELVTYREKNGVERADMLNLLISLKNEGFVPPDAHADAGAKSNGASNGLPQENRTKLTQREISAQVFVFFLAGYETTSSTTSFMLYELAKHPDIQEKVVEEIDAVLQKHGGKLSYEAVTDMPYTEMVIQETLRLYPPVPFLTREAMLRRQLPLTDVVLDKGVLLMIPVHSLHYDPQHWEEPLRFDPLRFTEEAKKARKSFVYMPFGDGPRICIGMRLAMVQVKTALATVLSNVKVSLAPGMPREATMNPRNILPTPVGGIRLTFTAR
ncbi:Cytochrome P450 6k1 [Frankliniella fusca]|uniref:Cytochrome P450 6k1 n=1 Tax=Frankliniella fusca TaxID=407009 RepID=A0AAE1LCT9_9NEOP|nr:Cytochrome P450 6k1 [Frankliniella fusca]